MPLYRLDSGSHGRFEDKEDGTGKEQVIYEVGDEIELTDAEAEGDSLKGRVTPVAAAEPKGKKAKKD